MNAEHRLLFCRHGVTLGKLGCVWIAAGAMLAAGIGSARAQDAPSAPDPRITPGQVIDGWTGKPIPCRCRYRGRTYQLGEVVCMKTHLGTRLTRCELVLNNTSWVPTQDSCAISAK